MLTEAEVMAVLAKISSGEITVESPAPRSSNVRFEASNGWIFWVFNDCNSWDYLDSVEVDGVKTEFWGELDDQGDEINEKWSKVQDYRPPNDEDVRIWCIGELYG